MNELQVFNHQEFGAVRSVMINDAPWFVGKDVAESLGYSNPRDALARHVDDEDKGVAKHDTLGGSQDMVIINESGLYALIFGSKLESAKRFKRWVTSDVLPSIRRTGGYGKLQPSMDDYLKVGKILASCKEANLPYVIEMCNQLGFNLKWKKSVLQLPIEDSEWDKIVNLMQEYTLRELMNLLNISKSCASYYRSGRYKPYPQRRQQIIEILTTQPHE